MIESLTNELTESKNLIAAMKCENDEVKVGSRSRSNKFKFLAKIFSTNQSFFQIALESTKANFQIELARVVNKKEVAEAEVKKWETMYNEWMSKMEERVGNINRTQNLLQV